MLNHFSCVRLSVTPWTAAHQAPPSMGFSKQEYWGGLPCPPPGDLPDPGIESASLVSPALADGFFTTRTTWEISIKPLTWCCEKSLSKGHCDNNNNRKLMTRVSLLSAPNSRNIDKEGGTCCFRTCCRKGAAVLVEGQAPPEMEKKGGNTLGGFSVREEQNRATGDGFNPRGTGTVF